MSQEKKQKKPKVKKEWKELPACQVSDALLWETTKNYTSYIIKNNGLILSSDPLNLTKLNTKKDSGVAPTRAIGMDYDIAERNVKYKKKKEKRPVMRFNLNIKTKKKIPKKKNTMEMKLFILHNQIQMVNFQIMQFYMVIENKKYFQDFKLNAILLILILETNSQKKI